MMLLEERLKRALQHGLDTSYEKRTFCFSLKSRFSCFGMIDKKEVYIRRKK